ncbi:MAG: NAD(P)/FAD-dependent oxidoreductase, partial [Tepidiformaceae bacterium]
MAISRATERITADDDTIREALADAFLPALLPALAQATGDISLLRDDLRPAAASAAIPQGGMSAKQQDDVRALALDPIKKLRDGVAKEPGAPDVEEIRAITSWLTGSDISDDYIPLLLEELAPFGEDPRSPHWHKDPGKQFFVTIIGAGMSGILAGIRLKQA